MYHVRGRADRFLLCNLHGLFAIEEVGVRRDDKAKFLVDKSDSASYLQYYLLLYWNQCRTRETYSANTSIKQGETTVTSIGAAK